ncbi:MAG: exopolysaccharide biosynthesis polyprenyl glycosylphosphotransferase [Acidobacteria bacterium]|nr:exopolysaccharide biosynthesis polyprenyl glycosylphosphotransferase [Acidobacteriota bacterium]
MRPFTGAARGVVLLVTDTVALLASGVAATLVWAVSLRDQSITLYVPLAALVPLFPLSYALAGLYPGFGVSAIHLIRTLSRQTSLVFLAVVASVYALRLPGDYSRGTLAIWWVMALVVVPVARAAVSALAVTRSWWREPVLLIGDAHAIDDVIHTLARARHIGYRPVGVLLTDATSGRTPAGSQGIEVVAAADLSGAADRLGTRTVLLADRSPNHEQWVADLGERFRHVISVHPLEDRYVEPVAIRYLGNSVGIEIQNRLLMRRNRILKRAADLTIAAVGLLVTAPVMVLAAFAIVLRDPGPWWHVQVREGRGGRAFPIWKLRTMYRDADARLEAHLLADAGARAEWQREFKLTHDPRVLPIVGGLLRRWSLDECPQFWNVMRGEMSLVGPRALPLYHLDAFDARVRALRRRVRPGMTGMWQVMSRGEGGIRRQEALDSYYIYNWSIWMDIFILARTVLAVVSGRGAR